MEHSDRLKAMDTMNFIEFMDSVYCLLELLWGEDYVKFTMKHPQGTDFKNITMPIITYGLTERQPGQVGRDSRELKMRERETICIKNKKGENETVRIMGRVMDYMIEFNVYAVNNKQALKLSEGFMDIIETYKGVLLGKGMQNMWIKKESEVNPTGQEDYAARKIEYLVRLEELTATSEKAIEKVRIQAELMFEDLKKKGKLPSQQN